jgi:hypothetical protein
MTSADRWRGRLMAPAPLHQVVTRELTAAMRQIRAATGDTLKASAEVLNATLAKLYPETADSPARRGGRHSAPHPVTEDYLSNLERGTNARLALPPWLRNSGVSDKTEATYGSRVRPWLVRAYDVAFGADGYLIDMYSWATALRADHEHDPPRMTKYLPGHMRVGEEYAYLSAGLTRAPSEMRAILQDHARILRDRGSGDAAAWHPSKPDSSGSRGDGEEANPEGVLVQPGEYRTARWVLHNTGSIPWRDRLLYRVGPMEPGIVSSRFLPIPDTDPGDNVEITWVVRAPQQPGTYRMCLKAGWPNGVYCFPSTLVGLIFTMILPPDDLTDARTPWRRR